MNFLALQNRVRSLTRDFSNSIFRQSDVQDYINESIDRLKQVLPQLNGMVYLSALTDTPTILPAPYHHLLAEYAASRLYAQDGSAYQATTLMNEFETKLEELKSFVESGDVVLTDATGTAITTTYTTDAVVDNYFYTATDGYDVDNGVDGVPS